jgi:hypothetical protein
MDFTVTTDQQYEFIAHTMRRFGYARLKRADKVVVLRFLERISGYSLPTDNPAGQALPRISNQLFTELTSMDVDEMLNLLKNWFILYRRISVMGNLTEFEHCFEYLCMIGSCLALRLNSGCFWIIDNTGKGKCSVGVACQYCGQLGKQDNC